MDLEIFEIFNYGNALNGNGCGISYGGAADGNGECYQSNYGDGLYYGDDFGNSDSDGCDLDYDPTSWK